MCRNIRVLFNFKPPATEEEIRAAALQYVRKVSGATRPSNKNQLAFDHAVDQIADITRRLLQALETHAPARDPKEGFPSVIGRSKPKKPGPAAV